MKVALDLPKTRRQHSKTKVGSSSAQMNTPLSKLVATDLSVFFACRSTGNAIKLTKSEEAEGFFNDGLTFLFKSNSGLLEVRP